MSWCCAVLLLAASFESPGSAQSWLPINTGGGALPAREPAGYLITKTPHPSVARIVVPEKTGVSFGSGTLIDVRGEHGLLVTNWHVVRDASGPIYVFFPDGFQTQATVVKQDRDWDLAALSIRKPPSAQPLTISQVAPRAGDWLCIAGYGPGDYRAAAGRCTQYVSPATHLPYEMVEVAAEARQGDSGGPIINERGELAGVLFGSGKGTTSGSYAGRVLNFLHGVVPVDVPATAPTANLAAGPPAADAHLFAEASPPALPALSAEAYAQTPVTSEDVTPIEAPPRAPLPLMPLPDRRNEPLTLVNGEEPVSEDRTALRPAPSNRGVAAIDGRDLDLPARDGGPIPAEALNVMHTPLPSRLPVVSPLETAPADQLIAAAWKQVGGSTLFDQGKTLLAVLGLLGLGIQFWRLNSRPDPVDED